MFFINNPDPFRNASYDSFLHKGKIVHVKTSYVRIKYKGENVYSITITKINSCEGELDLELATKVASSMLEFISHIEDKEYELKLSSDNSTFIFDVVEKGDLCLEK